MTKRTAVKIAVLTFMRQSVSRKIIVTLGIVIAAILTHWFLFIIRGTAAPESTPPMDPDLGRPKFANPCEILYDENKNRLRGVIEIVSGKFLIPNQGVEPLRQFRNGDKAHPCP